MKPVDQITTAVRSLRRNVGRSVLTTLGIVIGVAAVILVMAMSQGAANLILQQVQGVGSQTIVVRAGRDPRGPSDFGELFTDSLRTRELEALRDPARAPGVVSVSPNVVSAATAVYGGETARVTVLGTAPAFLDIFSLPAPDGTFITEDDVRARADVVVLGSEVKRSLFGDSDALGETIKIRNANRRVIGVFPPIGQAGIFDLDRIVMVPYSTAQQFLGIKHFHSILVRARSEDILPRLADDIRVTLRELHDVSDPDKDDFFVATQADLVRIIGTVTSVLGLLLVSIAAVSLVVGGIGIMNIMLVSVTERTREIGLRKALGATTRNILVQFLVEAVLLTVVGGLIGVVAGGALSVVASVVLSARLGLPWVTGFPWFAALLGVAVSVAVGVAFGLYPARRASRKDPIEALRYE